MSETTFRPIDIGIHTDTQEITGETLWTIPRGVNALVVNATAGDCVVTIPSDRACSVVKGPNGDGAVILKPSAGKTIIGFANQTLTQAYSAATTIWTSTGLLIASNFTTASVRKVFHWLGNESFTGSNTPKIVTVGKFSENSLKPGRVIKFTIKGTFDTTMLTVAPLTVELHLGGTVNGGNITGSKMIATGNMPALSTNVTNQPFAINDLDLYILDNSTLQSFGSMQIVDNTLVTKNLDIGVVTPIAFDPSIAYDVRARVSFGVGVNGTNVKMRSFLTVIY